MLYRTLKRLMERGQTQGLGEKAPTPELSAESAK